MISGFHPGSIQKPWRIRYSYPLHQALYAFAVMRGRLGSFLNVAYTWIQFPPEPEPLPLQLAAVCSILGMLLLGTGVPPSPRDLLE